MPSFISYQDLNIVSIIHQLNLFFFQGLAMDRNGLLLAVRSDKVTPSHHRCPHMWAVEPVLSKLKHLSHFCVVVSLPHNILRREAAFRCSTTRLEHFTRLSTAMVLSSGDPQVGSDCTESLNVSISPRHLRGRQIRLHRGYWSWLC